MLIHSVQLVDSDCRKQIKSHLYHPSWIIYPQSPSHHLSYCRAKPTLPNE